ncbi:hypothetical protein N7488_008721 [Penicillium malachiteum]|nr:hypothetical protein N7488_008721 [Penicillium malachiteum]
MAETPLCELLQEFGPLLPVKNDPIISTTAASVFFADSLYVSLLNAATLSSLGGIQIEWIENISSHLHFDLEAKKLFIFRLPSFCYVNHHQSVALSRLLDEYYDEFNRPTGFTRNAFLKEIRLSYQLIFGDSSSSRRFYKRKELRRLRKFGPIDPELNLLCGLVSRISHPRDSYSMITDFSIFASRLSTLQDHIIRQNPNSLRMIWRDTRNSYQWWTFWAVVIFGGLGILLSLIQTGLAAAQVYYALHPV